MVNLGKRYARLCGKVETYVDHTVSSPLVLILCGGCSYKEENKPLKNHAFQKKTKSTKDVLAMLLFLN